MRRAFCVLLALVICGLVGLSVSAATGISSLESHATVAADSSCEVSLSVTIHLEQALDHLYFPVPADASGITLNGSWVSASKTGDVRNVKLSRLVKGVTGDVTFHIHYSLHDVIHATQEGGLQMQLPLLCGFAYPVQDMSFSVTLPGQTEVLPAFVSGYHQSRIEEHLTCSVEGAVLSGRSLQPMKDHETLSMTLPVTEEMFPQTIAQEQDYHVVTLAMTVCAVLALVYWLIGMWNLPVLFPQQEQLPPQGYHAGMVGSVVAGQGVDLSLMILSWAQLGYVSIRVNRDRQVTVHKRMDMGNECTGFEQRCFQKLFGKNTSVNTSSSRYAAFANQVAKKYDGMQELMHRRSGNPMVFRFLCALVGLFGGVGVAVALAEGAALQVLLMILLGALGGISGWLIQSAGAGILLHSMEKTLPGLLLCAFWLLLSLLAGAGDIGLWMCIGLLVGGILLAWGGRRTFVGRQVLHQFLGLRRFYCRADKQQLQRLCQSDPDYFFRQLPYAMALGADRAFALRFGKMRMNGCPYLTTGVDGNMTALQWCTLLRRTMKKMNRRARQLPFEQLVKTVRAMTGR